jgi:hypothetical protein
MKPLLASSKIRLVNPRKQGTRVVEYVYEYRRPQVGGRSDVVKVK